MSDNSGVAAINTLVIYDGKPGHLTQSLGLANVISDFTTLPVVTEVLAAKPKIKLFNRPLRYLAQQPQPWLSQLVVAGYQLGSPLSAPADIVISFGGNSVALNLALARQWGARNIHIGNCYGLPDHCFTANITTFGNPDQPNAVASKVALCKIDRSQCELRGAALKQSSDRPLWGLLVGGDGSGYQFQSQDWQHLGRALNQLAQAHQIRWLISTSRRTGDQGVQQIRQAVSADACQSVIWYGSPSEMTYEGLLGASERLFCTEDSLSMLTESIAMGKPVISLQPSHSEPKSVHGKALAYLSSVGLLQSVAIDQLSHYDPASTSWPPGKSYVSHLRDIFEQLQSLNALGKLR